VGAGEIEWREAKMKLKQKANSSADVYRMPKPECPVDLWERMAEDLQVRNKELKHEKAQEKADKRSMRRSGFDYDERETPIDDWQAKLFYARQQAEALEQHQQQLQRLKAITYAEQVKVHFLKMPHDMQVLFMRVLTSDPQGKIAGMFELEADLKTRKGLPAGRVKQLTVGQKKKAS
jgi:hypothetical protein